MRRPAVIVVSAATATAEMVMVMGAQVEGSQVMTPEAQVEEAERWWFAAVARPAVEETGVIEVLARAAGSDRPGAS